MSFRKLCLIAIIYLRITKCKKLYNLTEDYNKAIPPSLPTKVNIQFSVAEIVDVDDKRHDFTLQGYLTLSWYDSRVQASNAQDNTLLDLDEALEDLWLPDIWIKSLRRFRTHTSIKDQATVELSSSSNLSYWQSVTATVSCPMTFTLYPFDCQKCTVQFSSNGLDVTKQEFTGTISKATEVSQIVQTEGALDFEDVVIHNDKFNKYNYQGQTREWPQVQADFFLKRRHLDHILLSFFPTTCLVVLSWISFLIPPYIVPGRMVLLVTLLLVVISTYQKQHDAAPRSISLKATDVWQLGCMVFVLAAIFEYAIVLYIKKRLIKQKKDLEKTEDLMNSSNVSTSVEDISKIKTAWKSNSRCSTAKLELPTSSNSTHSRQKALAVLSYALSQQNAKYDENEETDDDETGNEYGDVNDRSHEGEEFLDQIDYYSFRIFPIMFALANIPFWLYYLPKHMENCEIPKP